MLSRMPSKTAAQAIAECERVATLDRNLAFAQAEIGAAKIGLDRAEEAEAQSNASHMAPLDG